MGHWSVRSRQSCSAGDRRRQHRSQMKLSQNDMKLQRSVVSTCSQALLSCTVIRREILKATIQRLHTLPCSGPTTSATCAVESASGYTYKDSGTTLQRSQYFLHMTYLNQANQIKLDACGDSCIQNGSGGRDCTIMTPRVCILSECV